MTEQEWLTSTDPEAMLKSVEGKVSDRKLRLFACACVRRVWHLLKDDRSKDAVEVAELFADGMRTKGDLGAAWDAARTAARDAARTAARAAAWAAAWAVAWDATGAAAGDAARAAARDAARAAARDAARDAQASILRGIVGNPFRPVGLRPPNCPWLTPTVRSLAQAAYEERPGRACERCKGKGDWIEEHLNLSRAVVGHSRIGCPDCHGTGRLEDGQLDPQRLAVLGDAMEDAGCEEETVLRWLRGEERCWCVSQFDNAKLPDFAKCRDCKGVGWRPRRTPSYRGDWCIDLLLGKH